MPLAWVPDRTFAPPSPYFAGVLSTIAASDFLLWTMMKVAPMTLLKTILGTPVEAYRNAPPVKVGLAGDLTADARSPA